MNFAPGIAKVWEIVLGLEKVDRRSWCGGTEGHWWEYTGLKRQGFRSL